MADDTRNATIKAYIERIEQAADERDDELDQAALDAIAIEVGVTPNELKAAKSSAAEGLVRAKGMLAHDLVADALTELTRWRALAPFDLEFNLTMAAAHARRWELEGDEDDRDRARAMARRCSTLDANDRRTLKLLRRLDRGAKSSNRAVIMAVAGAGVVGLGIGFVVVAGSDDPAPDDVPGRGHPPAHVTVVSEPDHTATPPTSTAKSAKDPVKAAVDARPSCNTAADCDGASCDEGRCAPAVLAEGQGDPGVPVVDHDDVYWANRSSGTVVRLSPGDPAPTTLASGQAGPEGTAVDDTHVYWVGRDAHRVAKDGGEVEFLARVGFASSIAVDDESAYVVTGDQVLRLPKSGGEPAKLVVGQKHARCIALTNDGVIWCAWNEVATIPKAGADAPIKLAYQEKAPIGLAVDDTHVYWADDYAYAIRKTPLSGGEPSTVAQLEFRHGPTAVAVDASHVYWVDGAGGVVQRIAKGAPRDAKVETIAVGQARPHQITITATHLLWSNRGDGSVMRQRK